MLDHTKQNETLLWEKSIPAGELENEIKKMETGNDDAITLGRTISAEKEK